MFAVPAILGAFRCPACRGFIVEEMMGSQFHAAWPSGAEEESTDSEIAVSQAARINRQQ